MSEGIRNHECTHTTYQTHVVATIRATMLGSLDVHIDARIHVWVTALAVIVVLSAHDPARPRCEYWDG